jgi:hypothetical protein
MESGLFTQTLVAARVRESALITLGNSRLERPSLASRMDAGVEKKRRLPVLIYIAIGLFNLNG